MGLVEGVLVARSSSIRSRRSSAVRMPTDNSTVRMAILVGKRRAWPSNRVEANWTALLDVEWHLAMRSVTNLILMGSDGMVERGIGVCGCILVLFRLAYG